MRALNPEVIVESGVFRGLTTWVMRQACPQAEIFCFDPDLSGCATAIPAPATTPSTGRP